MTAVADHITACDDYLAARTGCYDYRRIRYSAAVDIMQQHGLSDEHTVFDIGAGWTEFDYLLRAERGWRGRYVPVDGWIDGTDLNKWTPPRRAEWFVALEVVEHVCDPARLIRAMQRHASCGVILSTPNPATTDVLGMDPTHVVEVPESLLLSLGFTVGARAFYGQPEDSLFAYWTPPGFGVLR